MKQYFKRQKRRVLKGANKGRDKLMLDRIPLRRMNLVPTARPHQWYDYTAGTDQWSESILLRELVRSDDDYNMETRPGNEARFMRSLLLFRIAHSASNPIEATYRILMVKFLEMAELTASYGVLSVEGTAMPREVILARAGNSYEWRLSPYTLGKDRGDDFPKYKVLYDQTFTFSNVGDRTSSKIVKMVIPGGRVRYKEGSSSGSTARGHIAVLILTTATAASAYYTFDYDYVVNFTSSGG
jgi:hypothetical protein